MRKKFNKTTTVILSILMCCSFMLGIGHKTGWNSYIAKAEDSMLNYKSLNFTQLDDVTYRTVESALPAQITVFTHGLGGGAYHWSNAGVEEKFEYDSASMIEQLREKLEAAGKDVVVMSAGMNLFTTRLTDVTNIQGAEQEYVSSLSLDEMCSQAVPAEEAGDGDDGADSLRKLYEDYFSYENMDGVLLLRQGKYSYYDYDEENDKQENEEKNNFFDNLTLNDASKHIILIFEADSPTESNDYVYAQLEYVLDVISYQYLALAGILPTYNLVGFSRGGITNMQYALAHPYNVSAIYSIGAPYKGSAFGSATLDNGKNHPFLSLATYSDKDVLYSYDVKDYTSSTVEELGESAKLNYTPGVVDIIEPKIYNSYMSFWNNNFDYYEHINFRPVGTYVTFGYLLQTLIDYIECDCDLNDNTISILNEVAKGMEAIGGVVTDVTGKFNALIDTVEDVVKANFEIEIRNAWLQIIDNLRTIPVPYSHIGMSYSPTFVIADDLFIDLNSQIAYGYNGTEVKVRLMDTYDQIEGRNKKSVPGAAGVAHSLEPRDKDIVEYITETITDELAEDQEEQPFDYRYTSNGYYITNMNFDTSVAGELTIPSSFDGITIIGIDKLSRDIVIDGDDTYHPSINRIELPSTIQFISDYAFYGMRNLEEIDFNGATVSEIGNGAFMNCESLTGISLPTSVTSIGNYAFRGCSSLTSITIPSGVTTIGVHTFASCVNLTQINFAGQSQLTTIDDYAFYNCMDLQALTIPNAVTTIGDYAFYNCSGAQSIVLGEGVTQIGDRAFANCLGLQSVTVPATVNSLGVGVFAGCNNITQLNVEMENSTYKSEGNCIIRKSDNALVMGSKNSVIPNTVESIEAQAFAGLSFTSIVVPNSVTHIEFEAFQDCDSLTKMSLPLLGTDGDPAWSRLSSLFGLGVYNIAPSSLKTVNITNGTVVPYKAFENCEHIETITLPDTIVNIENLAFFGCSKLTNFVLPNNVVSIGGGAFLNCSSLVEIVIPQSVEEIGSEAFCECENLETVHLLRPYSMGATELGSACLGSSRGGSTQLSKITVPDMESVQNYKQQLISYGLQNLVVGETIGLSYTLLNDGTYAVGKGETEISGELIISPTYNGEPVTIINNNAFDNCTEITTVILPNTIATIGSAAFSGCTDITSITIPSGVISIGASAFSGCTGLTNITIPSGVTSIGANAFANCNNLTVICLKGNNVQLNDLVFDGCTSLEAIIVPNDTQVYNTYRDMFTSQSLKDKVVCDTNGLSFVLQEDGTYVVSQGETELTGEIIIPAYYSGIAVTAIADGAFEDCTGITSIIMSDMITYIGEGAFYGCSSLESVVMSQNVTVIMAYTFAGCSSLTYVELPYELTEICAYAFSGSGIEDIVIPSSVIYIDQHAFIDCDNLCFVALARTAEQGITEIDPTSFEDNGIICFVVFDEDSYYDYYSYFEEELNGLEEYLQYVMYL
ncbi:MAG: leucine-rich repeat protein [Clostridia bacterium]|nr:leucine-rich repeat protein [Clostridia bacterium]